MTAVTLDTRPTLCILCPPARARVSRPGGYTDWPCHERLLGDLVEIVVRYAQLTAVPGQNGGQGRRAPGFESRPPVNLHVAALRDPRTRPIELGEPHSALNLFITWARWMRGHRGEAQPQYPTNDLLVLHREGAYLTRSMDWVTRQEWVPTFAAQAKAVLSQLRSATGEPNPKPLGWCTTDVEGRVCGHPLFPPSAGRDIDCGSCGTTYDPVEQVRLRQRNLTVEAPDPGLCVTCGHGAPQHDNDHDHDVRPCNVRWCACSAYLKETLR